MDKKAAQCISPQAVVLGLLGIATLVKALWVMNSVGTCDVMLFRVFGKALQEHSLAQLYAGSSIFNHTPLTGWLVKELYAATVHDGMAFAAGLRFACILADVGMVLGLLHLRKLTGQPPWWALGLFAVSPVSIMVSGFHGNIDPIMVMLLFFAAVAVVRDRPVLCGVMFAAACNIKIVPILVAPVFILFWMGRGWRQAARFMASAGVLMLGGAAYGLIVCPGPFVRNVFGYGSYWGTWGVTYWLTQTRIADFGLVSFTGLSAAQNRVILALKVISVAGVLILAWRRRKLGGLEFFTTLAAAFTWLFVFMPGAGPQYMVWYAPFVLLAAPRWWVALMAGSAVYMARFYHTTAGCHFPWTLALPKGPEVVYWGPWTNLAWGVFVAALCWKGREWFLVEKREPVAEPAAEIA